MTSKGPLSTTSRTGEFKVNYTGHNFGTTPGQNDIRIKFYEHFADGNNSDIFALLGGDRIRKTYAVADDSPSSIIVTSEDLNTLKFNHMTYPQTYPVFATLCRDTLCRDTRFRDTLFRDTLFRDTLFRDNLVRDTLFRDTHFKDTLFRDTLFRDTLFRDNLFRYTLFQRYSF
jgi:hypothetical protein